MATEKLSQHMRTNADTMSPDGILDCADEAAARVPELEQRVADLIAGAEYSRECDAILVPQLEARVAELEAECERLRAAGLATALKLVREQEKCPGEEPCPTDDCPHEAQNLPETNDPPYEVCAQCWWDHYAAQEPPR